MEYVLKTNSLCKNYGHFKALNGLSMNVPKGSIYGLIGKTEQAKQLLYGWYVVYKSLHLATMFFMAKAHR